MVLGVEPFAVRKVHSTVRIYENVCVYDSVFLPVMDPNFAWKYAVDPSVPPLPMLSKAIEDVSILALLPFVIHRLDHK